MAYDDRMRGSGRSRYNAEEDMRRGTIFDRSRRRRGNYDLPQDIQSRQDWQDWEEDYYTGFEESSFSGREYDMDYPGTRGRGEWWEVPGPFVGVGPKDYHRSDERILEDVCDRLSWHGEINAEEMEVEVQDGKVLLSGEVEDRRSKYKAEEAVQSISGVRDVRNQLRVKQRALEPGGKGKASLPGISRTQMGQSGFQSRGQERYMQQRATEKLDTLEGLFFEELKDIYDAEKQILEAQRKFSKAANSADLKRGLKEHSDQTQRQIQRIEQIFQEHGRQAKTKQCLGIMGIIMEGERLVEEPNISQDVLDAGLIHSVQKIEHYEIATYGTLRTYAKQLGYGKSARLLDDMLNEASKADERLTSMAVGHINIEAKK